MHIGEVVGGVAVAGVAVLMGLAILDDDGVDIVTSDTSPFVFEPVATSVPASTSGVTNEPVASTASPVTSIASPVTTQGSPSPSPTEPPPPTTAEAASATTPPRPTDAPTTTLIPPAERADIPVRVLNGGSPPRSATFTSAALRNAGFDPLDAADATRLVDRTMVFFSTGQRLAALTVNDVVGARRENVVPVPADDPNWAQFGDGLAVLVVLGPSES